VLRNSLNLHLPPPSWGELLLTIVVYVFAAVAMLQITR
jgi:hypothetical protein